MKIQITTMEAIFIWVCIIFLTITTLAIFGLFFIPSTWTFGYLGISMLVLVVISLGSLAFLDDVRTNNIKKRK